MYQSNKCVMDTKYKWAVEWTDNFHDRDLIVIRLENNKQTNNDCCVMKICWYAAVPTLLELGRIVLQKRSIRRFVITEKDPIRAFSWLKAATTTFTFKSSRGLLRDYEPSDGTFWSTSGEWVKSCCCLLGALQLCTRLPGSMTNIVRPAGPGPAIRWRSLELATKLCEVWTIT